MCLLTSGQLSLWCPWEEGQHFKEFIAFESESSVIASRYLLFLIELLLYTHIFYKNETHLLLLN